MDMKAFESEVEAMRDLETSYPFKLADMMTAVRKYQNVPPAALLSQRRKQSLVTWRWRIIYLASNDLGMSLMQIARLMNRDHTSIHHALQNYDADADIVELDRLRFLSKLCAKDRQCE